MQSTILQDDTRERMARRCVDNCRTAFEHVERLTLVRGQAGQGRARARSLRQEVRLRLDAVGVGTASPRQLTPSNRRSPVVRFAR